ncbi:MAG: hypothetical protein OEY14_02665 [Myxococcales bacterium]|nr:hypothetical protein [Myxococcales bacterium]
MEELYFRSDSAYFCMLLNRRTRSMRVVDFRAGALPAKRLYIQSVAKREDIQKVITLVEKDEVSSWTRVGFVREGTIPGFYKRSDGHLCGCVIGDKTASEEISDGAVRLSERTINAGKKAIERIPDEIKGVSVKEIDASDALAARDAIWKAPKARPVSSFDSFGRDAARLWMEVSCKRSKPNYISAEYQDCFGHALIEVLRPPESENGLLAVTQGLRQISEMLQERGIVAGFSFVPLDDVDLSTAYLAAGYRKTGLVAMGAVSGDERKDAILWTRKLANPAGEGID